MNVPFVNRVDLTARFGVPQGGIGSDCHSERGEAISMHARTIAEVAASLRSSQ
jgi:hypothetical protein